jgi:RimJ/RimL family protein N-acetyltransferase
MLRTESFVLRPWRLDDADALNAATQASVASLKPWLPWADEGTTPVDTLRDIRRMRAEWLLDKNFVIGIFASDDRTVLGGTGFHPRDGLRGEGTTEIGMWVASDEAGKGLASAVLRSMLTWGFTDWWWHRIEWRCDPRNLASASVARKAGMHLDGVLRQHRVDHHGVRVDTMVWSLLRDEWPSGWSSPARALPPGTLS